jgi:hypothetical protein
MFNIQVNTSLIFYVTDRFICKNDSIFHLDAMQIAEILKFNLTIPEDNEELPVTKFQLRKKAFAIACYSHMPSKISF